VILEGAHRPGTYGTVKVVTDPAHVEAIRNAAGKLPVPFDERLPLEILVRATFRDELHQGVYSHDDVEAVPLCAVYARRWIYDLAGDNRWRDQIPFDVDLWAERDAPVRVTRKHPLPRGANLLEVEATLSDLEEEARERVRRVFVAVTDAGRSAAAADLEWVRERLVQEADRFHVGMTVAGTYREMPPRLSAVRAIRKQFLVSLAVGRILGRGVRCDDESIRRHYPKFRPGSSPKSLVSQFKATIRGKMVDDYALLVEAPPGRKACAWIEYLKKTETYALRLSECVLVLRLRL
jgi:hypothetical protein